MQLAAFTQRTSLSVTFLRVLSLPIAAQTSRSIAAKPGDTRPLSDGASMANHCN